MQIENQACMLWCEIPCWQLRIAQIPWHSVFRQKLHGLLQTLLQHLSLCVTQSALKFLNTSLYHLVSFFDPGVIRNLVLTPYSSTCGAEHR